MATTKKTKHLNSVDETICTLAIALHASIHCENWFAFGGRRCAHVLMWNRFGIFFSRETRYPSDFLQFCAFYSMKRSLVACCAVRSVATTILSRSLFSATFRVLEMKETSEKRKKHSQCFVFTLQWVCAKNWTNNWKEEQSLWFCNCHASRRRRQCIGRNFSENIKAACCCCQANQRTAIYKTIDRCGGDFRCLFGGFEWHRRRKIWRR